MSKRDHIWHDGKACISCHLTEYPHGRGGVCVACLLEMNKYIRRNRFRAFLVPSSGSDNNQLMILCLCCNMWKDLDYFEVNPQMKRISKYCTHCRGKRIKAWCVSDEKRAYEQGRRDAAKARRIFADEQFALWEADCKLGGSRLIDLVRIRDTIIGWIEKIKDEQGSYELAAIHSGVNNRKLSILREGKGQQITVEIVEKLCTAANGDLEPIIPTGRDDWGPRGERHCEDCGSWWHDHHCKGYCRRCYQNFLRRGREANQGFWSPKHRLYACLRCGSNKHPHTGNGFCKLCNNKSKPKPNQDEDNGNPT